MGKRYYLLLQYDDSRKIGGPPNFLLDFLRLICLLVIKLAFY